MIMFINRETELRTLEEAFERATKGVTTPVLITGLRRIGKTALMLAFRGRLRQQSSPCVYFDCAALSTPYIAYRAMFEGILESLTGVEYAGSTLSAVVSAAGECPSGVLRDNMETYIRCREGYGDGRDLMSAFFQLPEQVAQERSMVIPVLLDEFQGMVEQVGLTEGFKGKGGAENLIWLARGILQHHQMVLWIFSSSAIMASQRFFKRGTGAFYGLTSELSITGMDRQATLLFIDRLCTMLGTMYTIDAAERIYELTDGFPSLVGMLVQACGTRLTLEQLDTVLERELFHGDLDAFFTALLTLLVKEAVGGEILQTVVHVVARGTGIAAEVARELGVDSHYAYVLLKRLADVGLMTNTGGIFRIAYPLMREWLLTRPLPPVARPATVEELRTELGFGFEARVRELFRKINQRIEIPDDRDGRLFNDPGGTLILPGFRKVEHLILDQEEFDVVAEGDDGVTIAECKMTKAPVAVEEVVRFSEKLRKVVDHFERILSLFISASGFTPGAIQHARGTSIVTVNLEGLNRIAEKVGVRTFKHP